MNIIFGAGSNGHDFLKRTKTKINYFVDNDKNLWNKKISSIKCLKPSDLKKLKFKKIIIASPAIENIKSQLKSLKIDSKKIQVSPYLVENFDEMREAILNNKNPEKTPKINILKGVGSFSQ